MSTIGVAREATLNDCIPSRCSLTRNNHTPSDRLTLRLTLLNMRRRLVLPPTTHGHFSCSRSRRSVLT